MVATPVRAAEHAGVEPAGCITTTQETVRVRARLSGAWVAVMVELSAIEEVVRIYNSHPPTSNIAANLVLLFFHPRGDVISFFDQGCRVGYYRVDRQ